MTNDIDERIIYLFDEAIGAYHSTIDGVIAFTHIDEEEGAFKIIMIVIEDYGRKKFNEMKRVNINEVSRHIINEHQLAWRIFTSDV